MSVITAPITPGPTKAAATQNSNAFPSNANSANNTLTQADFLKIMVAQFTNQAPPDSSGGGNSGTSDYINELMSMTNLTTMQTMSQQQSMQLAGSLPGSTVLLNNNGAPVSGVVTSAAIENATLYVTVNGTQYPASDLVSVTQSQAQALAASNGSNSSSNSGTGSNGSTPPTTPTS